jgi:tetratricopeptide (TPR) repeat protein
MKALLFIQAAILIAVQAFPQTEAARVSKYGKGADSVRCVRNLSVYSAYYKSNDFEDAIGPWREVFNNCPASRESLYQNGVNMYKSFLEAETDTARKSAFCDTIMMIYDQRIAYFGGEGKNLGRKGRDLLHYRGDQGEDVLREGYGYLKRSVELEGSASTPEILAEFISAGIALHGKGLLSAEQLRRDYFKTSQLLEAQMNGKTLAKAREAKDYIDFNIPGSKVLSCDELTRIFQPKFLAAKNDIRILKNLGIALGKGDCEDTRLYADVAEKMYNLQPSSISTYRLAHIFLQIRDYDKCIRYYELAADSSRTTDDRAKCCYELAILLNNQLRQPENAVKWANEAISLKPAWGDACILLGIIYASSSGSFEEPIKQKAVYWLAVDILEKAKAVDPSVAKKADKLIAEYSGFFPDIEDVFFYNLTEGGSYSVGGWINRSTTVRAKKTNY